MFHYMYGIILGLIQGLTEFLPVSSSGHLFVTQFLTKKIFNNIQYLTPFTSNEMPLLYIILLHVATLCSVLFFTRTIIKKILRTFVQFWITKILRKQQTADDRRYIHLTYMVCFSTLATLPIGLILKNTVINTSLETVIIGFFITALLLCLPSLLGLQKNTHVIEADESIRISGTQAIIIGLIQGCSVLPGISRSGSTIVVGVLLGLSFMHATYFSFILAIPAILASFVSSVLEASSNITQNVPISFTLISMGIAFLSGLLALACITRLARKKKLWVFSFYLLSMNIVLLFLSHTE